MTAIDPIPAAISKLTVAVDSASKEISRLRAALEAANAIPRPTQEQIDAAAQAILAESSRLTQASN